MNYFKIFYVGDYSERVVARFSHKIQSEYYVGNRSVSIEGISLEHFSAFPKADVNSTKQLRQRHAVFHSFLSDDIKQDSATTNARSKSLIALINEKKVLTTYLSKIRGKNYGCSEHYICPSVLYLMSVMPQCYSVIIYQGISAPDHGK